MRTFDEFNEFLLKEEWYQTYNMKWTKEPVDVFRNCWRLGKMNKYKEFTESLNKKADLADVRKAMEKTKNKNQAIEIVAKKFKLSSDEAKDLVDIVIKSDLS